MTDFVTRTVMDKTMWLVTLPKIITNKEGANKFLI
ncbi:Uncharacterised protein [Klebsiella pneumoniae]|uniref:Uncharacterized protein n=1 Tax=Klebsiella pneumoniae TaxID=573 RepID=A0ABD7NWN9_KLEPN|nr:hypothetical protein SM86_04828 [Klebsiella pneumoniae]SAV15780.1 Uncharacterised protein [Klebsiella pneumoniae]SVS29966.1 Uncharacterised protein [Klebsiella pneumoniae]SVW97977.1 Uncharacterised protein [Klebsiella pneumoniae]SXK24404.1 Uncharacterised protein [Klebsiella pneumoniae]